VNADDLRAVAADIREPRSHAAYIKAWHPGVALAVADWLDGEANWMETGRWLRPRPARSHGASGAAIAFVKAWRGKS